MSNQDNHLGRAIPTHLRTLKHLQSKLERKHNKAGQHLLPDGSIITAKMKEYCEELVFGGVYRTLPQWAELCGVSLEQLRRWNKMAAVQTYLSELREVRRQQMQENFEASLGMALNELLQVIRLDMFTLKGKGKKAKLVVNSFLAEQKRTAIVEYLNYMRGTTGSGVKVNINNMNSSQAGAQVTTELVPGKDEIESELRELQGIECALEKK